MVASASLADVEPGCQPGGGGVATVKRVVMPSHVRRPWFFPDGKMPLLRQAGMSAATFPD